MGHIKYPKIRRLGMEETEGILQGDCIIQEKIDGANSSVRIEDGQLCIGSRTQLLCRGDVIYNEFNGLVSYIKGHAGILNLLEKHPTYRLYGERLVPHTIKYAPQYYKHFWMYDILVGGDEEQPEFMNPLEVIDLAEAYLINHPHTFGVYKNPYINFLTSFFEQPQLGDKIEGIVIKNRDFINKYGRPQYAKLVSERFKEENKIVFGNANKYDELELRRALKYTTPGRFLKLVHKLEQDKQIKFSEKNIAEILGRMQYDVITEEIVSIIKNETVNFGKLRKEIINITRTMALSYIEQGENANIFIYNKN